MESPLLSLHTKSTDQIKKTKILKKKETINMRQRSYDKADLIKSVNVRWIGK